jgi:hypothetical protein
VSAPDTIEEERSKYTSYADFYIPYYLRPNVVPERCVSIQGLSSIVGNLVEDSIPLRTVLRSSQSPGIIFSLFANSLKGFRSQPDDGSNMSLLENFISARTRTSEIDVKTIQIARGFGLKSAPKDIEAQLCNAVKGVQRHFSPCHGDLHSGNVMVRGKDAILIDFSAVKNGPITADPITLEVSLIFGTDKDDQSDKWDEWKTFVNEIYSGVPIHQPPSLSTDPGPFSWLYKAIWEIRHVLLGCDCKQEETPAVLAAYLLRFGRLPMDKFPDDALSQMALSKQAYAIVIAERIVNSIPP